MLGDGVKKIIFSIWSDLTTEHSSAPDWKKESFRKFKDKLIEKQKEYAKLCNAEYFLFKAKSTDYINVQFDKLLKFEELTKEYDQVVYFDLDIIPITKTNIFEQFDFDYPCVYDYDVNNNAQDEEWKTWLRWQYKHKMVIDSMNRYSKVASKNAMLLIEDVVGNDRICNTAVVCGNRNAANLLKISERLSDIDKIFSEAKVDNVYPREYSEGWVRNNEVYFSFILERYDVKYNNIGIQWNYVLDSMVSEFTSGVHLIHQVNKDFEKTFTLLESQQQP